MCSGCVCAHFKGVYARYWIPEGDAPAERSTGHRRKGYSSPGQSNSDDRTHVCGLIGHIVYRSHRRRHYTGVFGVSGRVKTI